MFKTQSIFPLLISLLILLISCSQKEEVSNQKNVTNDNNTLAIKKYKVDIIMDSVKNIDYSFVLNQKLKDKVVLTDRFEIIDLYIKDSVKRVKLEIYNYYDICLYMDLEADAEVFYDLLYRKKTYYLEPLGDILIFQPNNFNKTDLMFQIETEVYEDEVDSYFNISPPDKYDQSFFSTGKIINYIKPKQ